MAESIKGALILANQYEVSGGKLQLNFLEHPFWSLKSRGKDMNEFSYESNDGKVQITVIPSKKGRATIRDSDFVSYLQAKLVEMKNRGELNTDTPEMVIEVAEFLEFANRADSGGYYSNVEDMLDRVAGTAIRARYEQSAGKRRLRVTDTTTIIDPEWKIIEETGGSKKQLLSFKVRLRSWFVSPIRESNEYLTIPQGYFGIAKDMDRRLWQIARMHANGYFEITWEKFYNKVGTRQSLAVFRSVIRREFKEKGGIEIEGYRFSESEDRRKVIIKSVKKRIGRSSASDTKTSN